MSLKRAYVDVPWGQAHVRFAGAGRPVILLHASPLHAGFVAPQIEALSPACLAIGIDTPGYGASDPLPASATTLDDYADAILQIITALGHQRVTLYGTATGAQIALAAAKRAPARIERLVLENCGHFDPALRAQWEAGYFPDVSPRADGGHLGDIWSMCVKQMTRFPWHLEASPDAPPAAPPSVDALQAMTLAYLQAGPAYARAYRLAFHAEDAASFSGLTTPTVLIDWESSVVRTQIHALIAAGLPACVHVLPAAQGMPARLAAVRKAVLEALA